MTDADYLYCLLHEMLDREEAMETLCPACREKAETPHCSLCGTPLSEVAYSHNDNFDMARFLRMKEAFPDRPHFQWDENGRYTGAMIRAGKYPAAMPRYDEEDEMTQEVFNQMLESYFSALSKKEASPWSGEARAWAEANGIITGDENGNKQYKSFLTREQMAVLLKRFSELKK